MSNGVIINGLCVNKRLYDVSLNITGGRFVHVLGENGAGKTSLLSVIAGLLPFGHGTVQLNGRDIKSMQLSELASFRGYHQQLNGIAFELTAAEFIQFFAFADYRSQASPLVLEHALEVNSLGARKLTELSGGELQRINLCRALLQVWPAIEKGTALLLLDEPLQGLDIRHQYALMDLLHHLTRKGNTVVMTSHDLNLSVSFADQIVLLRGGRLVAAGAPETVIDEDSLRMTFNCEFSVEKLPESMHIQVRRPIVR